MVLFIWQIFWGMKRTAHSTSISCHCWSVAFLCEDLHTEPKTDRKSDHCYLGCCNFTASSYVIYDRNYSHTLSLFSSCPVRVCCSSVSSCTVSRRSTVCLRDVMFSKLCSPCLACWLNFINLEAGYFTVLSVVPLIITGNYVAEVWQMSCRK